MERIITIDIPQASWRAIENPTEIGDFITDQTVREDIDRIVAALKTAGEVSEGDEISVNLRPNDHVSYAEGKRMGKVETIYREDSNGKGAIDSTKIGFTVELAGNATK